MKTTIENLGDGTLRVTVNGEQYDVCCEIVRDLSGMQVPYTIVNCVLDMVASYRRALAFQRSFSL